MDFRTLIQLIVLFCSLIFLWPLVIELSLEFDGNSMVSLGCSGNFRKQIFHQVCSTFSAEFNWRLLCAGKNCKSGKEIDIFWLHFVWNQFGIFPRRKFASKILHNLRIIFKNLFSEEKNRQFSTKHNCKILYFS